MGLKFACFQIKVTNNILQLQGKSCLHVAWVPAAPHLVYIDV